MSRPVKSVSESLTREGPPAHHRGSFQLYTQAWWQKVAISKSGSIPHLERGNILWSRKRKYLCKSDFRPCNVTITSRKREPAHKAGQPTTSSNRCCLCRGLKGEDLINTLCHLIIRNGDTEVIVTAGSAK